MEVVHIPVLLEETLKYLAPRKAGELMIDATVGEGGHSFAFLSQFQELKLIGIDADPEIIKIAQKRLEHFGERVQFYNGWSHDFFTEYPEKYKRPDTILIDLGVSLFHYEKSGRGFSFRYDEKLDMRIDSSSGLSAADLIDRLSEKDFADLLFANGEERYSRRIAAAIGEVKSNAPINSSAVLAEIVEKAVPPAYRHGPIHPATRTFQALRIAVNGELSRLPGLLEAAFRILEPGGRLGVISFHSLEDRIVKQAFKHWSDPCNCPRTLPYCICHQKPKLSIITKKPIRPDETELCENPRASSAKLRIAEGVAET